MKDTVSDWRPEIDSIDAEMLGLLNRRAQIALRVGDAKRRDASPLYDPHREVIERLTGLRDELEGNRGGEPAAARSPFGQAHRLARREEGGGNDSDS